MSSNITKLRFYCQKVLPLVYDDSLSYYEVLCKVSNKLNESIGALDNLSDTVASINTDISGFDTRLSNIENTMDTFESTIDARFEALSNELDAKVDAKLISVDEKIAEVDAKVDEIDNKIDDEIARISSEISAILSAQISRLEALINDQLALFRELLDLNNTEIKAYVESELRKFEEEIPDFENVYVKNPYTGQLEPLQNVINTLFDSFRWGGLSARELDELQMTVNELDNATVAGIPRGLRAIEFDTQARRWLWKNPVHEMYNLVTGIKESYKRSVDALGSLFRVAGCYSASEFDSIGINASALDELGLSAYQLDWHSNTLIV